MDNLSLINNYTMIIIVAIIILLLILVIVLMFAVFNKNANKNNDINNINKLLNELEKSIIKDSNEGFVKILNQNQLNVDKMTKEMQESLEKLNNTNEKKLNEIRYANEEKLNVIEKNINDKLDKSLNERLDSSFKTIGEQLQNLQVTNGKLLNMSTTITDLQKSLSNVKTRGVFGEKQLDDILSNIMTQNMYETQFRIKNNDEKKIDFAIKIPNKDDDGFIYLPIDAKFPNDRYLDVIEASENRDEEALKVAIKNLKDEVLKQAKSISDKYIEPPITTEFAIMFLPTEGLYAECLRIKDLADVCQKDYNVLLAGPTTITALINSFSIGFKFLQVNKNSKEIAKILQAIKVQYGKFDEEIDKAKKSLESATRSTEQLSKRNKIITSKLKSFEEIDVNTSDEILGIDESEH
ncbi:MAG: DNA recombination protein RmuC [Lachnospiraceae bacterium]|nr:DNA recombination protein RmuC [Lachnospiraceae bacterium]